MTCHQKKALEIQWHVESDCFKFNVNLKDQPATRRGILSTVASLQNIADLPPERVDSSPPFTYCDMDCFGPFLIKQGRRVHKRYGLLFTCFFSRAVHIEILDDMSTDAFINGLRCFITIHGQFVRLNVTKEATLWEPIMN